MIFRETRKFLKSSPILSVAGVLVMMLGFSVSLVSLILLVCFSSPRMPGIAARSYATIAELSDTGNFAPITWDRYQRLANSSPSGIDLAAYSAPFTVDLEIPGRRQTLNLAAASIGIFSLLNQRLVGRAFNPVEEQSPQQRALILSDKAARELYGGVRTALGRSISLNGRSFLVIGIAPSDFRSLLDENADAWVSPGSAVSLMMGIPESADAKVASEWRSVPAFAAIASSDRLTPKSLLTRLQDAHLLQALGMQNLSVANGLTWDPSRDERIRRWCHLGLLMAVFFTVVSCLDVCLLLMARAPVMVQESLLKKALGASRPRLLLEMMIGPALLLISGLVASGFLGLAMLHEVEKRFGFSRSLISGASHTLFFAVAMQWLAALSLIACVTLLPALFVFRETGAPNSGYSSTGTRSADTSIMLSVALQIACCTVTSILAVSIVSALVHMLHTPLGYDPGNLHVVTVAPNQGMAQFSTGSGGISPEAVQLRSVMSGLESIPGVSAVGYASSAPFTTFSRGWVQMSHSGSGDRASRPVEQVTVSPNYFSVAGMHLMAGQGFRAKGGDGAGKIILSRTLAEQMFAGSSAVGKVVQIQIPEWSGIPAWSEPAIVIGVVEDVRKDGFSSSPEPSYYNSYIDAPFMDVRPQIVVRGNIELHALLAQIDRNVGPIMPGMGAIEGHDVGTQLKQALLPEKRRVELAIAGASIMSLMAYIGLYASLTYYVRSKRRDLAVRLCFGASASTMSRHIVVRAMRCASVGIVVALPLVWTFYRIFGTALLGAGTWSMSRAILVAAMSMLLSIAVAVPSGRTASKISPVEALKT